MSREERFTIILFTTLFVAGIVALVIAFNLDSARDSRCTAAGGVIIKGGYCVSRSAVINL